MNKDTNNLVGLRTERKRICKNCLLWKTFIRGKTCRRHKVVKFKGKKVTGAPEDYSCDKYVSTSIARCGDCSYWDTENRPRKRMPCSKLGLLDKMTRKQRTAKSVHCNRFSQRINFEVCENYNLRVDGTLANVIRLDKHSEQASFLIQCGQHGVALKWLPTGPGEGQFEVVPAAIRVIEDNEEDNSRRILLKQYVKNDGNREVLCDGYIILCLSGKAIRVSGQQHRIEPVAKTKKNGVSKVVFRMSSDASRKPPTNTQGEKESEGRIQDELWGSAWGDLKEQMQNLLQSGIDTNTAVISVQRNFFREYNIVSPESAIRLQQQLRSAFAK